VPLLAEFDVLLKNERYCCPPGRAPNKREGHPRQKQTPEPTLTKEGNKMYRLQENYFLPVSLAFVLRIKVSASSEALKRKSFSMYGVVTSGVLGCVLVLLVSLLKLGVCDSLAEPLLSNFA
jgi:hypothetical protein